MIKLLVVDDDPDVSTLLQGLYARNGYDVSLKSNGRNALESLRSEEFQLALFDFRLPDMDGMELLRKSKSLQPRLPVIIITGYSDVRVAINSIKAGAFDYVTKPLYPQELLDISKKALNSAASTTPSPSNKSRKGTRKPESFFSQYIIGKSRQSQQVTRLIELVGPTDMSVVISGETGTGKEYVARRIHDFSDRSRQTFVAIDCGALPKELAGSELFGHRKGAFTGALEDKIGSFELADKGTLFLDEIANLSYANQIKLLRVLQERKIRRIGSTQDKSIDVRILTATNADLKESVKRGEFREDLYHRITEFFIEIAPIRARKEDIIQFATFFLEGAAMEFGKEVKGFTESAAGYIMNYHWHGNLRELRNVIKRATLLTSLDVIDVQSLPDEICHSENVSSEDPYTIPADSLTDLKTIVERVEKAAIIRALERFNFNKTKTAAVLKVDRKTLYNKMRAYGIDV